MPQVPEEAYGNASNSADAVVPPVQADGSLQQRQCLLSGDEQRQESSRSQFSAEADQLQSPTPRLRRLPLPKLKSLVRPKSTLEKSSRRTDLEEGFPAQTPQQRVDHTPSAPSSNSAMSVVRNSVPKLNFLGCSAGGFFKRTQDKDSVDGQPQLPAVRGNVTCDSNQEVHAQQRSQQVLSALVSPQLKEKKAQGISSAREHLVWDDEGHVDGSQYHVYKRQAGAGAAVSTEADQQLKVTDQDCGKESVQEEGEYSGADDNDVAGADTAVECENEVEEGQLEVEEGEISEASLPATSFTPASPRITQGITLIKLKHCNLFVLYRQEKATAFEAEPWHSPQRQQARSCFPGTAGRHLARGGDNCSSSI